MSFEESNQTQPDFNNLITVKFNTTRDSGFSETTDENDTSILLNNGIQNKRTPDCKPANGAPQINNYDLVDDSFNEVHETLITVINTIVRTEVKNHENSDEHFIMDVKIEKSREELMFANSKENKILEEIEKVVTTPINSIAQKISLPESAKDIQVSKDRPITKDPNRQEITKFSTKENDKKRTPFNNILNFISGKKKVKSAKNAKHAEKKTEEVEVEVKQGRENGPSFLNTKFNKKKNPDLLDNNQMLRLTLMKHKVIDTISDNLNIDKSNQNLVKQLTSRSVDLLRYNKVGSFQELNEKLKKEYRGNIPDCSLIDKFQAHLEELLVDKCILKSLELEAEPQEKIIFPCDLEGNVNKNVKISILTEPSNESKNENGSAENHVLRVNSIEVIEEKGCELKLAENPIINAKVLKKQENIDELKVENLVVESSDDHVDNSLSVIEIENTKEGTKNEPKLGVVKKDQITINRIVQNTEEYSSKYAWSFGLDGKPGESLVIYTPDNAELLQLQNTVIDYAISSNKQALLDQNKILNSKSSKLLSEDKSSVTKVNNHPNHMKVGEVNNTKNSKLQPTGCARKKLNTEYLRTYEPPSSIMIDLQVEKSNGPKLNTEGKIKDSDLANHSMKTASIQCQEIPNDSDKGSVFTNLSWREANEKSRICFYSGRFFKICYNEKSNSYTVFVSNK